MELYLMNQTFSSGRTRSMCCANEEMFIETLRIAEEETTFEVYTTGVINKNKLPMNQITKLVNGASIELFEKEFAEREMVKVYKRSLQKNEKSQ